MKGLYIIQTAGENIPVSIVQHHQSIPARQQNNLNAGWWHMIGINRFTAFPINKTLCRSRLIPIEGIINGLTFKNHEPFLLRFRQANCSPRQPRKYAGLFLHQATIKMKMLIEYQAAEPVREKLLACHQVLWNVA
jgi:hypothetical protein